MRHTSIVDTNLMPNLGLSPSIGVNIRFESSASIRAHFVNQLLLYECIEIPTKDFGILPALINWVGIKTFREMMKSGVIGFLHVPEMIGYVGNGVGLSTITIDTQGRASAAWWTEAVFADAGKAIQLQLSNRFPYLTNKEIDNLTDLVITNMKVVDLNPGEFEKFIKHESYKDVMLSDEISAIISILSGNPDGVDLTNLPTIETNQVKVLSNEPSSDPINIVLRIATLNLALFLASKICKSDLISPAGGNSVISSKLKRSGFLPAAVDNFMSLLDLTNMPDIGAALNSREINFRDIWRIRNKRISKRFRGWLRSAKSEESRDIERIYVESLGKKSFVESLPARLVSFAITTLVGAVNPPAGLAVETADSFFITEWMKGFSPKLFLDQLSRILPPTVKSND